MSSLNIISYNVRGIRSQLKRQKIMRFLNERKFDIVYIQESHSVDSDHKIWESEWGGRTYFSHGTNEARGVGIWIRKNSAIKVENCIKDNNGRYIISDISYEGSNYTLVNVYAPNTDEPDFFKTVFNHMEMIGNDYKVIGGDFNLVLRNEDLWGAANSHHAHKISESIYNK